MTSSIYYFVKLHFCLLMRFDREGWLIAISIGMLSLSLTNGNLFSLSPGQRAFQRIRYQ